MSTASIPAGTSIGHVHLKVADLERSIRFYQELMGFDITARYGEQAAFLSAGGYHHHIGLNTWESLDGQPPAPGTTGLYHFAILYPAATWQRRLKGFWMGAGQSMALPITAPMKRSICMTPISMASNWRGIARRSNGPVRMVGSRSTAESR